MQKIINIIRTSPFLSTLKHGKNYLLANLATKALGFITLPILTRLLTVEDYGVISLFNSYLLLFLPILTLNSYTSVGRYYYEDNDDFNSFFGSNINFVFLILAVSTILLLTFKPIVLNFIDLSDSIFYLLLFMVWFKVLSSLYQQICQPRLKSKEMAIRMITEAYGGFLLSIILIYCFSDNRAFGKILGQTVMAGLLSVFFVKSLLRYYTFSFKRKHIKYVLSYSLPLLPYVLSGVIIGQIDRIMINEYWGMQDTGLYSFAFQLGMLVSVLSMSLYQAWSPVFYKKFNDKNRLSNDFVKIFLILSCFALFVILFCDEIGFLLGKESFLGGLSIVPIIVIGLLFDAVFLFIGLFFLYFKKTIFISGIVVFGSILNTILNFYMIPAYGYQVSAYTSAVSYCLMAILSIFLVKIFLKEKLSFLKNVILMILALVCIVGLFMIFELNAIPIKIALLLIYGFSVIIFIRKI